LGMQALSAAVHPPSNITTSAWSTSLSNRAVPAYGVRNDVGS
jgi:hypothetical protein